MESRDLASIVHLGTKPVLVASAGVARDSGTLHAEFEAAQPRGPPKMAPLADGSWTTDAKPTTMSTCWLFTGAGACRDRSYHHGHHDHSRGKRAGIRDCEAMHRVVISITECATTVYEVSTLLFDDQYHFTVQERQGFTARLGDLYPRRRTPVRRGNIIACVQPTRVKKYEV
jgi:hypothetical protein